jgi:nucleoside-diphosphate-sugar epimerase
MILITGATGNNGLEIVKLLSRTGVACRALVRSSEKSGTLANLPGVEVAYGDFADPDTLAGPTPTGCEIRYFDSYCPAPHPTVPKDLHIAVAIRLKSKVILIAF